MFRILDRVRLNIIILFIFYFKINVVLKIIIQLEMDYIFNVYLMIILKITSTFKI
jgi:hypothetical protein